MAKTDPIKPEMTIEELKAAGILIDLPMEGCAGDPQPLTYGEGAPEKWTPDPEWAERSGFAAWQREQADQQEEPEQPQGGEGTD